MHYSGNDRQKNLMLVQQNGGHFSESRRMSSFSVTVGDGSPVLFCQSWQLLSGVTANGAYV